MEKMLNAKKYQYGDANRFRAFCEAIDEYNKWSKTVSGVSSAQEEMIAKACEGIVIEPKRAKTGAVIRAKKETCTKEEIAIAESIYNEEQQLRNKSILLNLAEDIQTMLKDNGFEGKNVSNKIIDRVYTKRDGSKGSTSVNSKDFPEVCKGLLDPLNPMLDLPTSIWLATLRPFLVSTGEFVIELRFISSYYNQYKDEYSNCVWSLKFTPSDRPVISTKSSSTFSSDLDLIDSYGENEEF